MLRNFPETKSESQQLCQLELSISTDMRIRGRIHFVSFKFLLRNIISDYTHQRIFCLQSQVID